MTSTPILPGVTARCGSCSAPIIWATTASGRATPLDAEAVPDGEWQLEHGMAVRADMFAMKRYRAHWVNCPQASDWRRR